MALKMSKKSKWHPVVLVTNQNAQKRAFKKNAFMPAKISHVKEIVQN